MDCFFVSDLHGQPERYRKLMHAIASELPKAVFLGGDLFPHTAARQTSSERFVDQILGDGFRSLREALADRYPRVFLIMGNDDPRQHEASVMRLAATGLWEYVHGDRVAFDGFAVYGYACVPPSPFRLKDWERYDELRSVRPGCLSPEEGFCTVPPGDAPFRTIADDLELLAGHDNQGGAIWLFHAPPHKTALDRVEISDRMLQRGVLDVHIGSIAIRRFIEIHQPLITLHGHIHESARLTGSWREQLGRTHLFNAGHDGPELALVRFDPAAPQLATRQLL